MPLEVAGKLIQKYSTLQITEKFKKREFILELSEELNGNIYMNYAKMQLVQNKCDLLDRFNVGDFVKVSFNIKGTKFMQDGIEKFITNLDVWRIESGGNINQNTPAIASNPPSYTPSPETKDDLPF